jgi:ribosomal protein S18 acetylase RimI-like enzyme
MSDSAHPISPYAPQHRDAIIELSLRAWAPVFASLEREMDPAVWAALYPGGWPAVQRASVAATCDAPDLTVSVALDGERVLGFVAVRIHDATLGEIYMIAVDPSAQRRGVARALTDHALAFLRERGIRVAMVETGGDPGHAPARAAYQSAGFRNLPLARYFRMV